MGVFEMELSWSNLSLALAAILFVAVLEPLIRHRYKFYRMRKAGIPMPPWNPFLGHIPVMAKVAMQHPRDVHPHVLLHQLAVDRPELGEAFLVDNFPVGSSLLVLSSPEMANQVNVVLNLKKHQGLKEFMKPISSVHGLVSTEGHEWKKWRSVFNPGFSPNHVISLVPMMVEHVRTWQDILRECVKKDEMFSLENVNMWLTMDIIGRAAMDLDLNTQRNSHHMIDALRDQINYCWVRSLNNPLRWSPLRLYNIWRNTRIIDNYLRPKIAARAASGASDKTKKTVLDLALRAYYQEVNRQAPGSTSEKLPSDFMDVALNQLKLFIFAGHDTTAGTISFCFYNLSKSPSALAAIRSEHDRVFGTDLSRVPDIISSNPHILNTLPVTTAVIKETLRLFPPASSTRGGGPGVEIVCSDGTRMPTEGCLVWPNVYAIHRSPNFWPKPDEFMVERWLCEPDDPLYPKKNAWRGFEHGPRNCIGQDLAMQEIRMALCMSVREFDIRDAYDEWDAKNGGRKGIKEVAGHRAYPMLFATSHPCDGFPARVSLARR